MKSLIIYLATLMTVLSLPYSFKASADEYRQGLALPVGWFSSKFHCSGLCREYRQWHNYVSAGLWHPETIFSVSGSGDTPGEANANMRNKCDGKLYDTYCD